MKSGPALRQAGSHRSIHDAAYREAREITDILERVREAGDQERSLEIAYILVEQWETRTLQHAETEEQGLYVEALEVDATLQETIVRLQRDHEILRYLVHDIKTELEKTHAVTTDIMLRFHALLPLVEFHSRQEEVHLVGAAWEENSRHGT